MSNLRTIIFLGSNGQVERNAMEEYIIRRGDSHDWQRIAMYFHNEKQNLTLRHSPIHWSQIDGLRNWTVYRCVGWDSSNKNEKYLKELEHREKREMNFQKEDRKRRITSDTRFIEQ